MKYKNRRKNNMVDDEVAYRHGLRRRGSDRVEKLSYYSMLTLMLTMLITLGVLSWLAL